MVKLLETIANSAGSLNDIARQIARGGKRTAATLGLAGMMALNTYGLRAGSISDSFDDGTIGDNWTINADSSPTIVEDGSGLNLNVASSGTDRVVSMNTADGDQTAEATFTAIAPPNASSYGVELETSPTDFVRLSLSNGSPDSYLFEDDSGILGFLSYTASTDFTLRLVRSGGTVTAFVSEDGGAFTQITGSSTMNSANDARLFISSANPATYFVTDFDWSGAGNTRNMFDGNKNEPPIAGSASWTGSLLSTENVDPSDYNLGANTDPNTDVDDDLASGTDHIYLERFRGAGPWTQVADAPAPGPTLDSSQVLVGDMYRLRRIVTDAPLQGTAASSETVSGTNTVGNQQPELQFFDISPNIATTPDQDIDIITATNWGYFDPDSQPEDAGGRMFLWERYNGSSWEPTAFTGQTLPSSATTVGERWRAQASVSDGQSQSSNTISDNEVLIQSTSSVHGANLYR